VSGFHPLWWRRRRPGVHVASPTDYAISMTDELFKIEYFSLDAFTKLLTSTPQAPGERIIYWNEDAFMPRIAGHFEAKFSDWGPWDWIGWRA
jgi:hypothetical protein